MDLRREEASALAGLTLVPSSPGELLDRLSILSIKIDKLSGERRDRAVALHAEFHRLADEFLARPGIPTLFERLRDTNIQLWEIEDELRAIDAEVFPVSEMTPLLRRYCKLARSVYNVNDYRTQLKREIDQVLGGVTEPKEYPQYQRAR